MKNDFVQIKGDKKEKTLRSVSYALMRTTNVKLSPPHRPPVPRPRRKPYLSLNLSLERRYLLLRGHFPSSAS